ncbi:MAG TPA: hypothetical protein VIS99_03135 [Terrimicrobiaceae bacterium]
MEELLICTAALTGLAVADLVVSGAGDPSRIIGVALCHCQRGLRCGEADRVVLAAQPWFARCIDNRLPGKVAYSLLFATD